VRKLWVETGVTKLEPRHGEQSSSLLICHADRLGVYHGSMLNSCLWYRVYQSDNAKSCSSPLNEPHLGPDRLAVWGR